MTYYVYILESEKDGSLYKGYTTDCQKRLEYHNTGKSRYTSKKLPWKFVYIEECTTKSEALKREKSLKRSNQEYLKWLITQPTNILKNME